MSTFRVPQPSVGSRGCPSSGRSRKKKPRICGSFPPGQPKFSSCLLSSELDASAAHRPPPRRSILLAACWMLELLKLHDVDICKPSSLPGRTPQG